MNVEFHEHRYNRIFLLTFHIPQHRLDMNQIAQESKRRKEIAIIWC